MIHTKTLSKDHKKLQKRLYSDVGRAIGDYNMIEEGDRVMVCLSGGKDSYAMLDVLLYLQKKASKKFLLAFLFIGIVYYFFIPNFPPPFPSKVCNPQFK